MMRDANEVEQIIARTLRDSLARLRRSSDELQEAVSDVVSACASTRAANSLPPIIRAQSSAASLAASLDVLARFITMALRPGLSSLVDQDAAVTVPEPRLQPAALGLTRPPEVRAPFPETTKTPETPKIPEIPEIKIAASRESAAVPAAAVISEAAMESQPAETVEERRASDMVGEGAPVVPPAAGAAPQEITAARVISEAAMESQPVETVEERRASDMVGEGAPVVLPAAGAAPQEITAAPMISEAAMESQPAETVEERRASDMVEEGAPVVPPAGATSQETTAGLYSGAAGGDVSAHAEREPVPGAPNETVAAPTSMQEPPAEVPAFDIAKLPAEQQELHRRANRVAKVSMQDIRMLRPNDVKSGKEHKDLCHRLRDYIERAHKEYDRRFQAILGHPVDYFYDWMVEILADGDPGALGEYPYPSPVLRH
jgi:hypothetical protein